MKENPLILPESPTTVDPSSGDSPPEGHRADPVVRELVLRAQNGSDEAYRALRSRYRPLLEASIARFASSELSRQERADLSEEAERMLLSAVSTYDCEQDAVDFGLYAKICLRNGLISEWRRMEARRRVLPLEDADALLPTAQETPDDPARRLMEEESFRSLCRTVRSHLSELENRVWWAYVTGVPVAEIAREIGRDERSVHNAIYRIRRKLRERISEDQDPS